MRIPMPSRGFTLAELAVAMVIVALLLASALWPLSTQMEMRAISETQRTMEEIRDAIIGFALATGRLPCPADGSIAASQTKTKAYTPTSGSTTLAAGAEQYEPYPPSGSPRCMDVNSASPAAGIVYGVVPWSTLGVKEVDAWGRRFGYRVSPAFTDAVSAGTWATSKTTTVPVSPEHQSTSPLSMTCNPPTDPAIPAPTLASFALCTIGDIAVLNPTITTKTPTAAEATNVPAVIVSYGKNGVGAYQTNGFAVAGTTSTHEAANVSATTTANPATVTPTGSVASYVVYSRERSPASSGCSDTAADVPFCEFDDILIWIPSSTLVARMVSAGRLP